jgi:DNA-binding NarL/FixJ family response regulator
MWCRGALAALVAAAGHEVVGQAGHGEAGVQQALALRPDVVITNWLMPVMDGVEATRQIRGLAPGVAVIALTSSGDPTVRDLFLEAGAAACLDKQDISGLRAALGELAHRRP